MMSETIHSNVLSDAAKLDPIISLARACIMAEHIYDRACEEKNEPLPAEALLLMAHLRAARVFAS